MPKPFKAEEGKIRPFSPEERRWLNENGARIDRTVKCQVLGGHGHWYVVPDPLLQPDPFAHLRNIDNDSGTSRRSGQEDELA